MARRDVAWGFFYGTADNMNIRIMWTRDGARDERRKHYTGWNPGPIFRIAPPKPKPKRGRK